MNFNVQPQFVSPPSAKIWPAALLAAALAALVLAANSRGLLGDGVKPFVHPGLVSELVLLLAFGLPLAVEAGRVWRWLAIIQRRVDADSSAENDWATLAYQQCFGAEGRRRRMRLEDAQEEIKGCSERFVRELRSRYLKYHLVAFCLPLVGLTASLWNLTRGGIVEPMGPTLGPFIAGATAALCLGGGVVWLLFQAARAGDVWQRWAIALAHEEIGSDPVPDPGPEPSVQPGPPHDDDDIFGPVTTTGRRDAPLPPARPAEPVSPPRKSTDSPYDNF